MQQCAAAARHSSRQRQPGDVCTAESRQRRTTGCGWDKKRARKATEAPQARQHTVPTDIRQTTVPTALIGQAVAGTEHSTAHVSEAQKKAGVPTRPCCCHGSRAGRGPSHAHLYTVPPSLGAGSFRHTTHPQPQPRTHNQLCLMHVGWATAVRVDCDCRWSWSLSESQSTNLPVLMAPHPQMRTRLERRPQQTQKATARPGTQSVTLDSPQER